MNQHYVPRIYLKHFADRRKNDYYVHVLDKDQNREFDVNIKGICAEKHLYTIGGKENNKDKFIIEKYYSEVIEPIYLKAYQYLIDTKLEIIDNRIRAEILIGLLQLYARNPILIKKSILSHSANIDVLVDVATKKNEDFVVYENKKYDLRLMDRESIKSKITEDILKSFKENHLNMMVNLVSFHQDIIIQVDHICDDSLFFTGDNPIPLYDGLRENEYPFKRSQEFIIPINKKCCVHLFHDKAMKQNKIYRTHMPNGGAHSVNDKIFKQSNKFVIGSKDVFRKYYDFKKIIDDFDLSKMMNVLDQVTKMGPHPTMENRAEFAKPILKKFVDKYKKSGTLSSDELSELVNFIRNVSKNVIKIKTQR